MEQAITSENNSENRNVKSANSFLTKKFFLGLEGWELIGLGLAIAMIALIALPNYFQSLEELRGKACSSRLTLMANCLTYLAEKNNTQPGEKICEQFDLNEILGLAQGISYQIGSYNWLYYKAGAEPDCAGEGDHSFSLYLNEEGKITIPTCSIASGEGGEYYRERGLHVCDVSKVDGKINIVE